MISNIIFITQELNLFKNRRIILLISVLIIDCICLLGNSVRQVACYEPEALNDSDADLYQEETITWFSTSKYLYMEQLSNYILESGHNLPTNYTNSQLLEGTYNISVISNSIRANNIPFLFLPYGSYGLSIWFQPKEYVINKFYFKIKELNFATDTYLYPFFTSVKMTSSVKHEFFFDDSGYCSWIADVKLGKIVKLYYCNYNPDENSFFYYDIINKHIISEREYNCLLKYVMNISVEQ